MISRRRIAITSSSPPPCSIGRYPGPGLFWRPDRLAHFEGQCLREAQVIIGFGDDEDLHARGVPFCHKHDPLRIEEAVRAQQDTQTSKHLEGVPTRLLKAELARRGRG